MNAGILTVWIITVLAILVSTGWRTWLVGQVTTIRLLVLAVGVGLTLPFTLPLSQDIHLHASACWVICWTAAAIRQPPRSVGQAILLLSGCVLATLGWYVLERMYQLDPVFVVMHPAWDGILIAGIFAGVLTWRFEEQLFLLILSLLAADIALTLVHPRATPFILGSWSWWDRLLSALIIARLIGAGCQLMGYMRARWQGRQFHNQGGSRT